MERSEFIRLVGVGVGLAALGGCLQGCKKEKTAPHLDRDFTLDLSQSGNSALNTNGGYLVTQGVIVARTLSGGFVAVASACTHEDQTLQYAGSSHQFHCTRHGSNFSESGAVVNGPADQALQQFNTSLTGQSLRVWSS